MAPQKTGAFIASLRKEQGWTQQALADKLQVSVKAISRWETGRGYPDVTILPQLADVLSVSVSELLNGERTLPIHTVEAVNTALLNTYAEASQTRFKNRRLVRWVCVLSSILVVFITIFLTLNITTLIRSLEGRSYCILANDFSYMTYYGERYVPLDTGVYAYRTGETIVDEVQLEQRDIFTKLLSEFSVHAVIGTTNNDLLYLQSEYDIHCFVKESCKADYEKRLSLFEPTAAYAVLSQTDGYDPFLPLDDTVKTAIGAVSEYDIDATKTCGYKPQQQRLTVVAYEKSGVFYKEYGDVFEEDGSYYWYDYEDEPYPDSVAHNKMPYRLNISCYKTLDAVFSYIV